MSKRHHLKIESELKKTLSIKGNNKCAECGSRYPSK